MATEAAGVAEGHARSHKRRRWPQPILLSKAHPSLGSRRLPLSLSKPHLPSSKWRQQQPQK